MLEVKKLAKSYANRTLFDNFSFSFQDKGFYIICGNSGCGKTSLLNILCGLDSDYKGDISFNDKSYKKYKSIRKLRGDSFGFIYQNFNLIEEDTVEENICLEMTNNKKVSRRVKDLFLNEILEKLGILRLKKERVSNLSGGEKQRVAVARAIIKNPDVIFADEPSGSLDQQNGDSIFEILKSLSVERTVICVTHDKEMAQKYADNILTFKNNKIVCTQNSSSSNVSLKIPTIIEKSSNKKITLKYAIKHSLAIIKKRKIRSGISNAFLSISLTILGVAFLLSSSISAALVNSFSKIVGENTLVLQKKSDTEIKNYEAATFEEVSCIRDDYKDDIDYIGVNYMVDFENFFPDINTMYNVSVNPAVKISGFNIRNFNEFTYLDNNLRKENCIDYDLKEDEIIMGFNFPMLKEICMQLKIVKSYDSLNEYLKDNNFLVSMYLKNNYWSYYDEQIFKVRYVLADTSPTIYHTDTLFNQKLFEDSMRFPSSLNPLKEEEYPWVMKKVYYVKTAKYQNVFLDKLFYDSNYDEYLFDSDNKTYSPQKVTDEGPSTNKLFVYSLMCNKMKLSVLNTLKDLSPKFNNYYYCSAGGLSNYGNSIINGFSSDIYVSKSKDEVVNLVDSISNVSIEDQENVLIKDTICSGGITSTMNDLKYSTQIKKIIEGNYPNNLLEIAISNGLKNKLELGDETKLWFALNTSNVSSSKYYRKKFKILSLNVSGVVEDDDLKIYSNSDYSISLFRDVFKISGFSLIPSSIVFEMDESLASTDIENFNRYLGEYQLLSPLKEIEGSINSTLYMFQNILLIFSFLTSFFSLVILIVINYINVNELTREIAIFKLLGYPNSQIFKIYMCTNVLMLILNLIISGVSLIGINVIVSSEIAKEIGTVASISFPYISIGIICFATCLLTFILFAFLTRPIRKVKILDGLR